MWSLSHVDAFERAILNGFTKFGLDVKSPEESPEESPLIVGVSSFG
jgi:hypothetical protein